MTSSSAGTSAAKAGPRPAGRGARPRPAARGSAARRSPPPRRVSGPARGLPQLRPLPVLGTIGSHAFRAGRSLHDSPLLDRLLRGRGWIGLLGVLLFGLVALNVSLLKLSAETGRNTEMEKRLRVQNDRLRAKVGELGSGQRIEAAGMKLGMVMPEPKRVRYLSVTSRDARRAAKALRSWRSREAAASVPAAPSVPAATPAPGTTDAGATAPGASAGAPATATPPGAPPSGTPAPSTGAPDAAQAPPAAGGQAPAPAAGDQGTVSQPGVAG
jgi:hypothetical protein